MVHPLAALWGLVLLFVLVADMAAYARSDQATVTATTRGLLAGVNKARNFWTSFVLGGVTVYCTGWYEAPPESAAGAFVWWSCSVVMFTAMIFWAIDATIRGRASEWLSRRMGVRGSGIRQCVFGFSVGGCVAHFGF